jgi:hypothetical protein
VKPRLLDLFCKAGGAGKGYADAGFEVVGVDIEPQPNYPFAFVRAEALEQMRKLLRGDVMPALVEGRDYREFWLSDFAAIHASPPCQAHVKGLGAVNAALGRETRYGDLIPQTRALLEQTGLPYVIENVEGAPLTAAVKLCGSSFGLPLRRHRLFEANFPLLGPPCNHSWQTEAKYWTSVSSHRGSDRFTSTVVQVYGNGGGSEHWAEAMGRVAPTDWMTAGNQRDGRARGGRFRARSERR